MTGIQLKNLLLSRGYRLVDVAEKLGITKQALNSKLRTKDVKVTFINDIERKIGVSLQEVNEGIYPVNTEDFNPDGITNEDAVEYKRLKKLQNKESLHKMALQILNMYVSNQQYLLIDGDEKIPVSKASHRIIADNAYSQASEMLRASENWVRLS